MDAVAAIAAGRGTPGHSIPGRGTPGPRFRSWPAGRHRTQQRSASQNGASQNGASQNGASQTGSPRAAPGGIGMSIMPCPGCGVPAEITERFILASTDGPITHVAVCCVDGHHYRMEADRLPADRSQPGPRLAAAAPARCARASLRLRPVRRRRTAHAPSQS